MKQNLRTKMEQRAEMCCISRFIADDAYNLTADERDKYLTQLVEATLGCEADELSCEDANNNTCFKFTEACDGTKQCNNGKDEANCTSELSLLFAS